MSPVAFLVLACVLTCATDLSFAQTNASRIVIISDSATIAAARTGVFVCVASGDPAPSISWSRGGAPLSNGTRFSIYEELVTVNGVTFVESILVICSVEQGDAAQYSCVASNSIGSDTANFNLTVNRMFLN